MFEQSLPRPTTRTPVNSILGGKVKGEGEKEEEREGVREIRGRRESYHVEKQSAPPGCRASDPSLSSSRIWWMGVREGR